MLEAHERPAFPDAQHFQDGGRSISRKALVSVVKLAQRRVRWLEKQAEFEQSLTVQRNQFLVAANADLAAFEAELRAEGSWDYQGPTARYAEYNLCKEMIVLAKKLSGDALYSDLMSALSIAKSELEAQVKAARTVGGQRWNIEKEALEGA